MLRKSVRGAMIAGIYVVLVISFAPISYGPVQIRIAEALTVLPFVWPEAVPGLFIGCLLANLLGGLGIVDTVLGSLATLLAAWLTMKMPKVWLAPLPPVAINALVVGGYLSVLYQTRLLPAMLYVAAGQTAACYVLGMILLHILIKYKLA
ncbi:MAG TPA: QueT transporter family protein [Firmicutes bacterium]|nr:QueT transporter family protein [Bacillota bacterium]